MDFSTIGSLNNYMRNMKMQAKWQLRKETGDFAPNSSKRAAWGLYEQHMEKLNNRDYDMEAISAKLQAGRELTPKEMEYLKEKNPMLYNKLKQQEQEKAAYERDLKRCKTREEVQRLKINKVNSSLMTINSVKNNPNIPKAQKAAIAAAELARLKGLEEVMNRFVKTAEYANLPTEAEKTKAEKDMKEAEEARREEIMEAAGENTAVEDPREQDPQGQKTDAPAPDAGKPAAAEGEPRPGEAEPVGEKKPTRAQAEQTPEAKKVRRSKYKPQVISGDGEAAAPGAPFSVKA